MLTRALPLVPVVELEPVVVRPVGRTRAITVASLGEVFNIELMRSSWRPRKG